MPHNCERPAQPSAARPYEPARSLLPLIAMILCVAALFASGESAADAEPAPGDSKGVASKMGADAKHERVKGVTYDDHGDPQGLHRYHRWSKRIGQGAQPQGGDRL